MGHPHGTIYAHHYHYHPNPSLNLKIWANDGRREEFFCYGGPGAQENNSVMA